MTPTDPISGPDALAARVSASLFSRDRLAQLLEIEILESRARFARLSMVVRDDFLNGVGTCHGGALFALADTAFAYCCNSPNATTVASWAAIDFIAPAFARDTLLATATELWRSRRTGLYDIVLRNQRDDLIAVFRGRSHETGGAIVEPRA